MNEFTMKNCLVLFVVVVVGLVITTEVGPYSSVVAKGNLFYYSACQSFKFGSLSFFRFFCFLGVSIVAWATAGGICQQNTRFNMYSTTSKLQEGFT